jgi:hypothetical protein
MRLSRRWFGSLLCLLPLGLGLREVPSTWITLAGSAAALTAPLSAVPDVAERDYRFLRSVATRLRSSDRLLLVQDFDGQFRDIAVPILSGGWWGTTDVVWLVQDAGVRRAALAAQGLPSDRVEQAVAFEQGFRRTPEEVERLLASANVVVAWRSSWTTPTGVLLVDGGPSLRAWRLR